MAITVVNQTFANSSSITIPATTAGNCLIVCVASASASSSISGITLGGSAGNFGQLKAESFSTNGSVAALIWADPDCAGGQTSLSISGSSLFLAPSAGGVAVYEVSGLSSAFAGLLDQFSVGGANGNWSSGTTPATGNAAEFWCGIVASSGGVTGGPASPWVTDLFTGNGGMSGYQVTSATGTATFSGTATTGATAAVVVTLNPAPPAPVVTVTQQVPGTVVTPNHLVTTPISTREGSWLAAFVGWNTVTSGASIPLPAVNVTDSAGNLWRQAAMTPAGSASTRCAVWTAPNALPVTWVSAALTGYAASLGCVVSEITGMPQAASLDFSVGTSDFSGTATAASLTWIASEPGIGLAAVAAGNAAETVASPPSGWTALGTAAAGTATSGCAVFGYVNPLVSAGTTTTSLTLGTAATFSYALCSLSASASPPPQQNQNFPLVTVEAAFGAQPGNISASTDYLFSPEYTGWTDITARPIGAAVQGLIKTKRGRPYQLQQQETGTCEIPLSNVDGAFTPTNPGSPYYSNAINANMSFQSSAVPWTARNGASLAQSTAQTFASGLNAVARYSALVTCSAATGQGIQSELVPVNPNYPYSASAWLYAGTVWAPGADVVINWYNAAQSFISTTSPGATALPAGQWTQFTLAGGTAPSGAAYARVIPQLAGTATAGFQFYAAEAALVTGLQTVQTGLVAPLTPIRVTAWWQGRRYPVWAGYAQAWPQEWPDMPQWGFSPLKAADALGAAAAGQMQSALIGETLMDNPYAYLPCNESYTSQVNGATPANPLIVSGGYLEPADANGLPAVNRASGNQVTGTYLDGAGVYPFLGTPTTVSTGLAMNFLGDNGTGMGATSYSAAGSGGAGPSMLYADPNLTNVMFGQSSAEFWFNWQGTGSTQVSLLTMFGAPSAFFATGSGSGAELTVYAKGTSALVTTTGAGGSVSAPLAPSQSPQHAVLLFTGTPGFEVYLNGAFAGSSAPPLALGAVNAVTLGPGRYSYDTNNAPSYFDYNFAAGHLAFYPYALSPARIAAHYQAGANGWQGVSASTRFCQILTWAQLGLKRGGWSQAGMTGQAEITRIGPAYDLSGQQASNAVYALAQSEGGRYKVQANGSLVYLERNAGYNLPVSAVLADGTAPAPAVLNADPGFAAGLAGWSGGGAAYSPGNRYGSLGAVSAAGTVTSPAFTYNGGSAAAGFWVNVPDGGTVTASAVTSAGTASGTVPVSPGAWSFLPLAVPAVTGVSSATLAVSAGTASFYLAWAAMWYSPGMVPYDKRQSYGFDTTYIYNDVQATQQDGPSQLIIYDNRSTTSQAQYFRRSALTFTPNVLSAYDVSDITTWNLAGYEQPSMHVSELTIDAASNPLGAFSVILPLDSGQVAQANRSPVGGAPITETGTVEQVSNVIGPGYWRASYQLSPYGPSQSVLCADTPGFDAPGAPGGSAIILAWLRGCDIPIPPSSYFPGPVSPQQIDTDLYGYPGVPSGVAFHASRPLLSETVLKGGTAYSSLVAQPVQGPGLEAYTVIDTTALTGPGADWAGTYAAYRFSNLVPASGGGAGVTAGQWLTWNFAFTQGVTAPPGGLGAGMSENITFDNIGTFQYAAIGHNNCAWHLDIVAPGSAVLFRPSFWWLTASVPQIVGNLTDTSGQASRMGWLWQCVTQGGSAVPSVPSAAANWGTVTSAALNGMGSALALLNNPPSLRAETASGQSFANNTLTIAQFSTPPNLDNYAGWSTSASNYTAPLNGLYLFSPTLVWGTASASGQRWPGLQTLAGGSTVSYEGPAYQAVPVGPGVSGIGFTSTAMARVFSLNAGDKIAAYGQQTSGVSVSLYTGFQSRLVGAYMTPQAPAGTTVSFTAPQGNYRFRAGALSGTAITAALNSRIGNDVNFLLNRPYFTGYQLTSQTGIPSDSGFHQVTIDTLGALPRGGNGDNWGGWSTANHWYVSQMPGWYLVMADLYASVPSATTAILTAGIFVSSSGGITPALSPDQYQQVYCPVSTGTSPPGATAIGMYYLSEGEFVYPMLQAQLWGGSWATFVNTNPLHLKYAQFSCFFVSSLRGAISGLLALLMAPLVL